MNPKFEYSALEKDIKILSKEVWEHKRKKGNEMMPEREALKSVISMRSEMQKQPTPSQSQSSNILPQYLQQESAEVKLKVEELINLAFQKGIDASIKEAQKFGPFVLDAFHDALTSKIYDELRARKLI